MLSVCYAFLISLHIHADEVPYLCSSEVTCVTCAGEYWCTYGTVAASRELGSLEF